jgi:hypothetical protein
MTRISVTIGDSGMALVYRGARISDMVRLVSALLASAGLACGFQQTGLQKDTYDIYSLLFTNTQTSHGADNNPVYLIADTTVPGTPAEPCVAPPADWKEKFAEVMADFARRKDERTRLVRQFNIAKPYRLVDSAEARRALSLSLSAHEETYWFSVGNVYFDRGRTIALTYLSSVCGGLCGTFRWRVFVRDPAGRWSDRSSWVNCVTMASK